MSMITTPGQLRPAGPDSDFKKVKGNNALLSMKSTRRRSAGASWAVVRQASDGLSAASKQVINPLSVLCLAVKQAYRAQGVRREVPETWEEVCPV